MSVIRKAVFPVAGLGTRFLPATKASPKEMMPVVDKPLIQYAVEEAIAAGIKDLIFITSGAKRAIEDHFDKNYELEAKLAQKAQFKALAEVQNLPPKGINCIYIRQQEALGLGHAVLCAKDLVGNEPFAVLLADDLIRGDGKSCLAQMVDQYTQHKAGVLAVEKIDLEHSQQYGIVEADQHNRVIQIVEKPKPTEAPSNLAVVGRYILPPEIFGLLEHTPAGKGGEIQLTDAIAELIKTHKVLSYPFQGKRYDCGSKLGYLEANLDYAMLHPEFGETWKAYLRQRFQS
ncbi:MAG: UTP--glucose-phosphate uridylyltransferase [Gammaproteobacteria bacterium]|jgi:UTP--glucose-1-phosphate uridylyltransferase|nr:UTP--glucose-phosphate uridylyltransferase [Gammaproteobacteria bacterium]